MDERIEDCYDEGGFLVLEIDPEYEFEASCYFDFCRGESFSEAQEAELWFETAGSYPPSPYIIKLHLEEDVIVENVDTIPKPEEIRHRNSVSNSDVSVSSDHSVPDKNYRATCNDHMAEDFPKPKTKSVSVPFSRCSTLMKPTASQLAKQNQPRFHKSLVLKNESSFENQSGTESQAAKRQKLEGGHLHKILDLKQQISLIHKVPQKDSNSQKSRQKLTIPREPQLRTAQRAQRLRVKNCMEVGEQTFLSTTRFKARRLNRKILEAPLMQLPCKSTPRLPEFREFHLKTSERAMQHSSAIPSSLLHPNNLDKAVVCSSKCSHSDENISQHQKLRVAEYWKQEESKIIPQFKAQPLDKKVLASKGEIGVFRTSKRGTTTPMEFNFLSEKRFQDPPIELFKMLSLTCGPKDNIASQSNMSQAMSIKGSKENMVAPVQQQPKIMQMGKETLEWLGVKQVQCGNHWGMAAIRSQENMCRWVGTVGHIGLTLKDILNSLCSRSGRGASVDRNEEIMYFIKYTIRLPVSRMVLKSGSFKNKVLPTGEIKEVSNNSHGCRIT